MGTKDFNIIDILIASARLKKVQKYASEEDTVLDFGCGFDAYLLKSVKSIIGYGVGLDYEVKNQQIGENIKLINFHYKNKLPFENGFFSKIFVLAVIEHFDFNKASILFKEFSRVLDKSGRVIITTPTLKSKKILEFLARRLKLISQKEIADHKKYYSEKDILDLSKSTGFRLEYYQKFQFGLNSLAVLEKNDQKNK